MQKVVAHFVRKSSQTNSSFINNQIIAHKNYKPVIIFIEEIHDAGGGYYEFNFENIPYLNLWETKSFFSKKLYSIHKLISKADALKINEFLVEHNVDILHFHYGSDASFYSKFLCQTELSSVVSFYGYDAYSFPGKYFGLGGRLLKKTVFKYISRVLVMSEEMKKDLLKIGCPENILINHYHGVPTTLSKLPIKKGNNVKTKLLIVSYLDPVKGHLFILESLKILEKKGFTDFELHIVGDGFFKEEIEKKIGALNLRKYVRLTGPVIYNSDKYFKEFSEADIFLYPSVRTKDDKEGIPGAIVEAMFAGLPVISTYHGGIPHVIESGVTGVLVKEWDRDGLSEAILDLIEDPELRGQIGMAGREYAEKNLSLEQKELELEEVYSSLIN